MALHRATAYILGSTTSSDLPITESVVSLHRATAYILGSTTSSDLPITERVSWHSTEQCNSFYIRKHHLFRPTHHRESVVALHRATAYRKHHLFRPTYHRESVVALHRATAYILGTTTSSDLPITESVVSLHRATAYILGSTTSSDLPITERVSWHSTEQRNSFYIRKHHLFRPTHHRESVVALHRATQQIIY